MGYFDNTRKNWIIAFLVILNIGLLISLWLPKFSDGRPDGPPHERQEKISRQFQKELDLDEAQFKELKRLREEHFQETRAIHKKIRESKREMFNALKGKSPDTNKANQIANEIGSLEADIDKSVIRHFVALREVCNAEQRLKLEKIFHQAIRKQGGKPGPKGNRRPPHERR